MQAEASAIARKMGLIKSDIVSTQKKVCLLCQIPNAQVACPAAFGIQVSFLLYIHFVLNLRLYMRFSH
jgi:hypothetical protein